MKMRITPYTYGAVKSGGEILVNIFKSEARGEANSFSLESFLLQLKFSKLLSLKNICIALLLYEATIGTV